MLRDESFDNKLCTDTVNMQFGEEMQCIADSQVLINAIGALINYLKETQKNGLERINKIELYSDKQYMNLDYNTQRNLELTATMLNKENEVRFCGCLTKPKPQWESDLSVRGLSILCSMYRLSTIDSRRLKNL